MTTIDHAAAARRVLGNFPHDDIRNNREALAWAQVHASLALVEQQRIANLIAIMSCELAEDKSAEFSEATAALYDSGKIRPDIKKGLGL